jgi:hypothetical protein
MKRYRLRLCKSLMALCLFASAAHLLPRSALSMTGADSSDQVRRLPVGQLELAQMRECRQRLGPFATQTTAWQRVRQAESRGYGVSGVFPCYESGSRGYCFNVFLPC